MISQRDYVAARHSVHALKGAAATLGADNLALCAIRLESLLRESQGTTVDAGAVAPEIDSIGNELIKIAAVLPVITPAPHLSDAGETITELPIALLKTLDAMLAENDAAAIVFYEQHTKSFKSGLGASCQKLEREIKQFSFEAAREILKQWI